MIMFCLIPNSVNVDKFDTLLIFYVHFLYVPPAITSNHDPMNRLFWNPGRKNNLCPDHVGSKAGNNNASSIISR